MKKKVKKHSSNWERGAESSERPRKKDSRKNNEKINLRKLYDFDPEDIEEELEEY